VNDLTIPATLDRRPLVGSYTLLNTFKNVCEHQAFRRYIKRDIQFVPTEASEWGNVVHKAFEERVGKGKVLPDNMRQWEHYAQPFDQYEVKTELQLGINKEGRAVGFWDGSTWFRGKIDVVVMLNDKAMITDWKTGSSRFEDPFELQTNALLLKAKFPTLRTVVGRYVYLKENKVGAMHDLSAFQATWQEICRLMAAIEHQRTTDAWPKKKSGLCGWCNVEDCENYFVARP
jgi:RecB family exonuclease